MALYQYRILYVPVRVTRGSLVAHWNTHVPPRCIYQYLCETFAVTLYSIVWDWRVLRVGPMLFYRPILLDHFLSSTIFFFLSMGW